MTLEGKSAMVTGAASGIGREIAATFARAGAKVEAQQLGISEAGVIRNVMLKDTVDGEFTTVQEVAAVALFFAAFPFNALTGQSLIVSHGWFME